MYVAGKNIYAALVSRDNNAFSVLNAYDGLIIDGLNKGERFQIPTNRLADRNKETVLHESYLFVAETEEEIYAYISRKLQEKIDNHKRLQKELVELNDYVVDKLNMV